MGDVLTPVNRQDFLKVAGVGALATAGVLMWKDIISDLGKRPTYFEIVGGEEIKVPLEVPGVEGPLDVEISYKEKDERLCGKLQARMENGEVVKPLGFEPGATRTRMVGEILDRKMVKVQKSSELPEDTDVAYYPSAGPPENKSKKHLDGDVVYYAIKVITWPLGAMGDKNPPPNEKNGNINKWAGNGDNNLEYFGEGYAVGVYDAEKKIFNILGYVCDARALEEVN